MSKSVILSLILASVGIAASAQILLRLGMSRPDVASSIASGDLLRIVRTIFANGWVLGGLFLYGLGAVTWLAVLAKVEVTYAFPFVGIGFVLVLVVGWLLMGESVTISRLVGTVLVALGVALIAGS